MFKRLTLTFSFTELSSPKFHVEIARRVLFQQVSTIFHAKTAYIPDSVVFFFVAEKVISINKKLFKKKRGECVTFDGEHYYNTNDTFQWKKQETTTMVSGGRIRISGDRDKTVEISRLEESDTDLYSAMIRTAGDRLEITRHWLVVRGRYW